MGKCSLYSVFYSNSKGALTVSEISFMMTSQMVAAIWIGMRIFPLRASPLVLSGGGQYAESHRGIFRLLYSNGIGDITSLQALENLTLLLEKKDQ